MSFTTNEFNDNPLLSFKISSYVNTHCTELFISTQSNFLDEKNQLIKMISAYDDFLSSISLSINSEVWLKIYTDDIINNKKEIFEITKERQNTFFFIIEQAPIFNQKYSIESYHINLMSGALTKEVSMSHLFVNGRNYCLKISNNLEINLSAFEGYTQTIKSFERVFLDLRKFNLDVHSSLIRSWLYIRDIDLNYSDIVKGRKEIFAKNDLTNNTHYISSTGIEGHSINEKLVISLYYLMIEGLKKEQIEYIRNDKYIGSTEKYGVTFERATKIKYGDRAHVFVSGTASINFNGEIMHSNNIVGQLKIIHRNINYILMNAGTDTKSIKSMTVYIRNLSDSYEVFSNIHNFFPKSIPFIIVKGKVCRPGWLVEIECVSVFDENNNFPVYL